jgi:hypothetical protein
MLPLVEMMTLVRPVRKIASVPPDLMTSDGLSFVVYQSTTLLTGSLVRSSRKLSLGLFMSITVSAPGYINSLVGTVAPAAGDSANGGPGGAGGGGGIPVSGRTTTGGVCVVAALRATLIIVPIATATNIKINKATIETASQICFLWPPVVAKLLVVASCAGVCDGATLLPTLGER